MWRTSLLWLLLVGACFGGTTLLFSQAADQPGEGIRSDAKARFDRGDFRDAFELYQKLIRDEANAGDTLANDLGMAAQCLHRLQQHTELDGLFEEAIAIHPEDWRVYWKGAELIRQAPSYGWLVAGEFHRGGRRGGGQYINVIERDRAQAVIWMNSARELLPDEEPTDLKSRFFKGYADVFLSGRGGQQAWQLQTLTDLETLPDYLPSEHGGRSAPARGAPVDEEGNPVFHTVPETFEAATSDGQRWRWCLAQAVEFQPSRKHAIDLEFARFLRNQFGVQTLRQWGIYLPSSDPDENQESTTAIWSLPTLEETETIARLANGVKRFALPDEFNFTKIYRTIAAEGERNEAEAALSSLGQIFEDRQQYPKAAEIWRESIERFGDRNDNKQKRLDQIVANWGRFEPVVSQPAGSGATVDYRFRNGNAVSFTAHRIKIPELIEDIKAFLKSNPQQIDYRKINIEQIGYRIVRENEAKYLGEQVAQWDLSLDPRPQHFDRRITVSTPLRNAGAYLLTARMRDGNTSRIIVWLNDTAIVKKQLDGNVMYYVADAVSGAPVERAKVEFFGWRQEQIGRGQRPRVRVTTQNFAEFTDREGMILGDPKLLDQNYTWLAIARDEQGRFAHLGFSRVWYQRYSDQQYRQTKVYVITDRPVYRPEQTVQFKFWIRQAQYDKLDGTPFANRRFRIKIADPEGTDVFEETYTTDEHGGLNGTFDIPAGAKLGNYYIAIDGQQHGASGGSTFRIEEYKKPEFEVTIEAPETPVELGETVPAKVKANYYFGAPVTQGTVQLKVERSSHDARWYPVTPWDWLYGNGYWWFASDYEWYPGFARWGCFAPVPPWWGWRHDPPELVLDQELTLGPDGSVEFEIDTSLAQALHGDSDHEYRITAEVTDASRRTIVGQGQVLVSRQPYKIFSWTHRGHYRVGDTIEARFQARTLDGRGVAGTGTLQLLQITYEDGEPVEHVVQEWDLDTDADGRANQTIKASQPGQYRLSYQHQVKEENQQPTANSQQPRTTIEGGYLFVIRGEGFDGSEFRFNDLELIADKQTYQPDEKVELLINTNRAGSTVLLFVRSSNGVALERPRVVRIPGKSATVTLDVTLKDMPNFFVEAVTIAHGKVHNEVRELAVPPEERVLNVEVLPSQERYKPGEEAEVEVKVTDATGEPFAGSLVMTVYDRAVEYISGGSNVPEIREFFWKWKRSHHPHSEHNLGRMFSQLLKQNELGMANIGVFGEQVADADDVYEYADRLDKRQRRGVVQSGVEAMGMGGMGGMALGMEADAAMPAAAAPSEGRARAEKSELRAASGEPPDADLLEPTVRTEFADTAFWAADLTTDAQGTGKVSFKMPENLTGWKIRTWGMGAGTNVGEATTEVVTAKDLIVRLQAPRFFTETDEVVLSANVHNYLETEKEVRVELELEGGTLELIASGGGDEEEGKRGGGEEEKREPSTLNAEPSTLITIPAGGEARVDWRVKAVAPGTTTVTMKALTDEDSDAMQMTFPVNVHGFLKTESFSGVIRPEEDSDVIEFTVPEERKPEQTRLEVRYSPTLAGAMVDALPYLVSYPYGCTEQTLNRFLPTVITQRILIDMGIDLDAVREKRTNLNAQEIGDDRERPKRWKRFDHNPVFDPAEVERMVKVGVRDLTAMQNSDGGWGWFSGYGERSWPHTTAVVVHGLLVARQNDVAILDDVLQGGINWLKRYQEEQVKLLQEWERRQEKPGDGDAGKREKYKQRCSNIDALVFSVLVEAEVVDAEMQRFLFRDRLELSLYSQALIGLAVHEIGSHEQRDVIVRNIDQFLKVDDENQTAFLDLPNQGYWWHWYGDTIEANAHYLKLLTRVNPQDQKAAGLVKYLLNNRRHGTYWKSTRDTAYVIESLAEYLTASGEDKPRMLVEVWLDGELKQSVEITPEVLFTFDNKFVIEGEELTSGAHTLELKKKSLGPQPSTLNPLYHNAYLTNFTLEEFITAAGLEIKVQRTFYKLVQKKEATQAVAGQRGQAIDQRVLKYDRIELENFDEVTSGDLIEIELEIDSKNDYEYILFEDAKAAGCEPVDVRSGYTRGGLGAYVEFRDERVTFFLRQLARGKHSVSYRVRAEIPGKFSALPTGASGMYSPELRANSDEMKLRIGDR
jgi:alpha-2-macroglobulin